MRAVRPFFSFFGDSSTSPPTLEKEEKRSKFPGKPVLTTSLGLILDLNDTRTLSPFANAVSKLQSGTTTWTRLTNVAVRLDACFADRVWRVQARRYGDLGALVFIIGEHAIAVEPVSFSGTPGVNLAQIRMARPTAEWFPPEWPACITENEVCHWISRRLTNLEHATRPMDDLDLEAYRGPRIFGESLLIDECLPTLLEGCACIVL